VRGEVVKGETFRFGFVVILGITVKVKLRLDL